MRFLRTASTRRLLGVIGAVAAAIAACAAVAVAATSGGPVPRREPLARAIHQALNAPAVSGITARVTFTNNLIGSSQIQGTDPLLQGATGRLWYAPAAHELRIELQSTNGDAQVLVHNRSFWMYDPSLQTVYEGTLPALVRSRAHPRGQEQIPSVNEIQSGISRLAQHLSLSGARPGDIAGEPAYTVRVAPRQGGGLLSAIQLGWDAVRGVPLQFAVYARGDSTPVLELSATNISFGRVAVSDFAITPPAGAKVVRLSSAPGAPAQDRGVESKAKRPQVTGVAAVQRGLSFRLAAPATVAGLARNTVALVHLGARPSALVTYGQGLGAIVVLEQASSSGHGSLGSMAAQGSDGQGLSLPTVSIHGTRGQELETALGTVIRFTRDNVSYTVLGSVKAAEARAAARGL
ncbi:MAG: hypothetical protein JO342_04525 [Solirubrobacterales bacterium]|nr:hypothetical protein [Solirubrobacterales bacterium]